MNRIYEYDFNTKYRKGDILERTGFPIKVLGNDKRDRVNKPLANKSKM